MILLAIDTALGACTVGVCKAGDDGSVLVLAERTDTMRRGHAEALFGLIEDTCAAAHVKLQEIDGICVSTGPGTFTGTRVGLAAARGLALGGGVPCAGVSTLEALAAAAPVADLRLAAIASRGDHVIVQAFAADLDPINEAALMPLAETPDHLRSTIKTGATNLLAGPAAAALADHLNEAGHKVEIAEDTALPRPADLVLIGCPRLTAGTMPRPHYVRPPDAKPAAPPPWKQATPS